MNQKDKEKFRTYVRPIIASLRNTLKSGEGRGVSAKEANYLEIMDLFRVREVGINTMLDADVADAAAILGKLLGNRTLEWQRPPQDNGAARKLAALEQDASRVSAVIAGVRVQLDCDQLKHQHPRRPIGSRAKGGGNRFVLQCDADWHRANTMQHMATWANGLSAMVPGKQIYHGQLLPVDGIHYEGYCLFANGQKYVSFHCYPANQSQLKL